MLAPKERDMMFIGGGIGEIWNSAREEALFYESYAEKDINLTALTYYRYERIVSDIAEFYQQILRLRPAALAGKEACRNIPTFSPPARC